MLIIPGNSKKKEFITVTFFWPENISNLVHPKFDLKKTFVAQKIVVNLGICSVVKGKNIFFTSSISLVSKRTTANFVRFFFHIDDGKQKLVVLLSFCFYQDWFEKWKKKGVVLLSQRYS